MIYYYLYKITNKINGKIYIGVHKTSNLNDGYMGSGKYISNSIKKYGIDNFEKEILKWFDTEDEMYNEEAELVNEEFIKREDTYNIGYGGTGGGKYVNENDEIKNGFHNNRDVASINGTNTCLKINKKLKEDKKYREYFNKRISDSLLKKYESEPGPGKGKKHTEESKRKIGQANSVHQQGAGNSQYGKCGIHNLELKQSKCIPKEDLQDGLDKGGIKGRKMKF